MPPVFSCLLRSSNLQPLVFSLLFYRGACCPNFPLVLGLCDVIAVTFLASWSCCRGYNVTYEMFRGIYAFSAVALVRVWVK